MLKKSLLNISLFLTVFAYAASAEDIWRDGLTIFSSMAFFLFYPISFVTISSDLTEEWMPSKQIYIQYAYAMPEGSFRW